VTVLGLYGLSPMKKNVNLLASILVLLPYSQSSYGVNIISGLDMVSTNGSHYMWLENNTSCQVHLKAWLTTHLSEGVTIEEPIALTHTSLNKMERTILTYQQKEQTGQIAQQINIMQSSDCSMNRLIKIKL